MMSHDILRIVKTCQDLSRIATISQKPCTNCQDLLCFLVMDNINRKKNVSIIFYLSSFSSVCSVLRCDRKGRSAVCSSSQQDNSIFYQNCNNLEMEMEIVTVWESPYVANYRNLAYFAALQYIKKKHKSPEKPLPSTYN